jgi:rubrerythrin
MVTPKERARLLQAENERLAKAADKAGDYDLAKVYWQLANHEASDLARMAQPTKPRGDTAKTAARKALLKDLRDVIKPANQEQFAWSLKDQKYRTKLLKHWSKKQIENDATLLNFIKKNRV